MCIQDFCNILGGGLVSYSTLTQSTINAVTLVQPAGIVICIYDFDPADVIGKNQEAWLAVTSLIISLFLYSVAADAAKTEDTGLEAPSHTFYAICWKGGSRTLNVMAGKVEIESMKHQLEALSVLRPKVNAVRVEYPAPVPAATSAVPATTAEVQAEAAVDAAEVAAEEVQQGEVEMAVEETA